MTDDPEGWRTVLEPATWVTCRVSGPVVHPTEGTAWLRVVADDTTRTDATLTIQAGWGGGGKYDHTEVVESAQEVRIQVLIRHRVPTVRKPGVMYVETMELRMGLIEVHLAVPMGERALIGAAAEEPLGRSLRTEHWVLADRPFIDTVTSVRSSQGDWR